MKKERGACPFFISQRQTLPVQDRRNRAHKCEAAPYCTFPTVVIRTLNGTFIDVIRANLNFRPLTFIKSIYFHINILTPLNCISYTQKQNSGKKNRYREALSSQTNIPLPNSTSLPPHHLHLSSSLPLLPTELQVSLAGKNIWAGYHPPAR